MTTEPKLTDQPVKVILPSPGEIVIYHMPNSWQPGRRMRIYPAIVLCANSAYGAQGVDLQVFCDPYFVLVDSGGVRSDHVSARHGTGPGEWTWRDPNKLVVDYG